MKSDPHLYPAEAPIVEGQDYIALCGKEIFRAKFVIMWDILEMGIPLSLLSVRCCKHCLLALKDEDPDVRLQTRYLYGIVSAGVMEQEEAA
jgi:hypothetical protein